MNRQANPLELAIRVRRFARQPDVIELCDAVERLVTAKCRECARRRKAGVERTRRHRKRMATIGANGKKDV